MYSNIVLGILLVIGLLIILVCAFGRRDPIEGERMSGIIEASTNDHSKVGDGEYRFEGGRWVEIYNERTGLKRHWRKAEDEEN